jgi:hypothetical protein
LAAVLRTAHWDASPGAPAHVLADTRVMLVLAAFAAAAVWVVIAAAR